MIKYLCHSLFIALLVIFPIKDSTAQEKVERETKIRSTTVSLLNESYNSINRKEGWDGEAIKIKAVSYTHLTLPTKA